MSSTSSPISQVISLPQGGGALHGIGETFAPDLYTGTGNFTVPITLPPGRNGLQPQLNLVYSSGNGNGPFGLGWSLSIPGISRKTSSGLPRYDDTLDTFILSGAEDLIAVADVPPGATTYHPRTEGLFARIYHHKDSAGDYWEVQSKDGLTSLYGTPRSVGTGSTWQDPAAIADPSNGDPSGPPRIFAWKLTSMTDPFGNRIEYLYERDLTPTDGPHRWDQIYLSQIRYADFGDPASPQFLVTVMFSYETRPDPFSDYRSGFEMRTVRRCTSVAVATHAGGDVLVRTYHLIYLDHWGLAPDQLPRNGFSLLNQLQVEGHDGATSEVLPPLEFSYTQFMPEKRAFIPVAGPDLPPGSLAHPQYELADLFGHGLPDILEMNGTTRYWRNLGGGRYDLPHAMETAPAGVQLADPGVQLIDANGDGRLDLLVSTPGLTGYYPMQFGGLWDRRSFQPYRVAPSFDLKDPEVRLVDLNGDGVTDAIRSGTRLECFFNDPLAGWNTTRWVERGRLEDFPNVDFADPRVKWADMTGDGLQDIILVYNGVIQYWPSLGWGKWGARVTMHNSPRFPYGYDPRRILLGDMDGDGLADVVYVDDLRVTLWINQSGNGWSDPIVVEGTPPVTDMDAVRLVDLLGNGVGGVLWSSDANGSSRPRMFFLDFIGGTKPYLLNQTDNHLGSITRVDYAPSTRFYLADHQQLATHWKTPLPFPVQVVARVEAIDALSGGKLTTEYSYHDGYWDGVDHEFRGFGRVDHRDSENFGDYHAPGMHAGTSFNPVSAQFFSPPTETRTWFHQGPIGDGFGDWTESDLSADFWRGDPQVLARPTEVTNFLKSLPRQARRLALRTLRGRILRTELYALDGSARAQQPYTVTEHLQALMPLPGDPAPWQLQVFFPYTPAERTTQWERGSDPLTQLSFTGAYDAYGQPLSQTSIAVPRGRDYRVAAAPGDTYLATHTVTSYATRDDPARYLVARTASTTTYEVVNDGSPSAFELRDDVTAGTALLLPVGQALNYYDGPAFQGLPFGQLGDFGALSRSETLILTGDLLQEAYKSGSAVLSPPEVPPYLVPGEPPPWTADYPQEFRDLLAPLAGYTFQPGGAGSEYQPGYFATTGQRSYDFQQDPAGKGRGMALATRDPLGNETTIAYDAYNLLPATITDPAGLTTQAVYDYRVLQPGQVTDPNSNRTLFTFSPLGLLASKAVMGKVSETVGDSSDQPSTTLAYDFGAFDAGGQPISVQTVRRVHHATETGIPLPERDATITTVEYSDGFGRQIQTRTQAEDPSFADAGLSPDQTAPPADAVGTARGPADPPRVVVSGWQNYDNKGRVVEKYEPFFSAGWGYAQPGDAERGQMATMYYDPRGRVVRTVNPDSSEQRVIYGVPGSIAAPDLTNPDMFEPTPWEAYTYDPNDNAGRTDPAGSASYSSHWNTPTSGVVDALGRSIMTTQRNGPDQAADWYTTRSTYDIRGNLLTVTDALGRIAFRYVYDLAPKARALSSELLDGGLRRLMLDAAGNPVEQRDSKGALILHVYDVLLRPVRLWGQDAAGEPLTLRELLIYGDSADSGLSAADAVKANLLGRLYRHYDEAGLLVIGAYDFKGNVLEKTRQVIADAAILAPFSPPPPGWQVSAFRVSWQAPPGESLDAYAAILLDATGYVTTLVYDALNRIALMQYPQDVSGVRKQLQPSYNAAGALESVALDGVPYAAQIAYNAKGQRTMIAYGNDVMTRYAYDPRTFRLVRMRTEPYTTPAALTYHPSGPALQDFAYAYDLTGNLLALHDRTPGCGVVPLLDQLDRAFTYDPIYRLLTASGRECDLAPPSPPWDATPRCQDPTLTRACAEAYTYDSVGNLTRLAHQAGPGGTFTRDLALASGTNQLAAVTNGANTYAYTYDLNGNLTDETTSRHFEWDHSDRMRVYRTQTAGSEPSVYAAYLYDAAGQRVKKLVRNQGGSYEVTIYADAAFEDHRLVQTSGTQQNTNLHVMDNRQRIALVRVGAPFSGDTGPAVQYHLGDHLGSSNVVLDGSGAWTNREEYTPYGETSFGSFSRKRYRFTGKERDEESGLYYHGARYYAPWLARWVSCDPAGMADGTNGYTYVRNNPARLVDREGTQGEDMPFTPATPYTPAEVATQACLPNQTVTGAGSTESTQASNPVDANPDPWDMSNPSTSTDALSFLVENMKANESKGFVRGVRRWVDSLRDWSPEGFEETGQAWEDVERVSSSEKLLGPAGEVLALLSGVIAGATQYHASTEQSKVVRGADSALTGILIGLFSRTPTGVAFSLGDSLTGGHASTSFRAGIRGAFTMVDAWKSGDTGGLEEFERRADSGQYGPVIGSAVDFGEEYSGENYRTLVYFFPNTTRDRDKSFSHDLGRAYRAVSQWVTSLLIPSGGFPHPDPNMLWHIGSDF